MVFHESSVEAMTPNALRECVLSCLVEYNPRGRVIREKGGVCSDGAWLLAEQSGLNAFVVCEKKNLYMNEQFNYQIVNGHSFELPWRVRRRPL